MFQNDEQLTSEQVTWVSWDETALGEIKIKLGQENKDLPLLKDICRLLPPDVQVAAKLNRSCEGLLKLNHMPAKKENVEKFLAEVEKTVDGAIAWKESVKKAQEQELEENAATPKGDE